MLLLLLFCRLGSGLLGCCCIGTAYGLTDLDYHGVDGLMFWGGDKKFGIEIDLLVLIPMYVS